MLKSEKGPVHNFENLFGLLYFFKKMITKAQTQVIYLLGLH